MTHNEALSLFTLAGFKVEGNYELMNEYWPRVPAYFNLIVSNPWWLVKTEYGMIKIGCRKKVISIDWNDTKHHVIVTEDDVTKDGYYVHAWSMSKALEYLTALKKSLTN